jgi:hypothetical protein
MIQAQDDSGTNGLPLWRLACVIHENVEPAETLLGDLNRWDGGIPLGHVADERWIKARILCSRRVLFRPDTIRLSFGGMLFFEDPFIENGQEQQSQQR